MRRALWLAVLVGVVAAGAAADVAGAQDGDLAVVPESLVSAPARRTGDVAGLVFFDRDGDGLRDRAEPGVGRVAVRLAGNGVGMLTTTQPTGEFLFPELPSGRYRLSLEPPSGWRPTTGAARDALAVADGLREGYAFGLARTAGDTDLAAVALPATGFALDPAALTGLATVLLLLCGLSGMALDARSVSVDNRS
jgi:hypothetical protein